MKEYNEVIHKIFCIVNIMNKTNKVPRDFGVGHVLYQAEIHTIEVIGAHENINANFLAKIMGVTNGAITQITDKLIQKGLVEKYKINTNKKEVYFRLTKLGKVADQEHDNFHEQLNKNLTEYLDQLKPSQIGTIKGFLDTVVENLPVE